MKFYGWHYHSSLQPGAVAVLLLSRKNFGKVNRAQHWMGLSDSLFESSHIHTELLSSHIVGCLPHTTLWATPTPSTTGPTGGYPTGIPHSSTKHSTPTHNCGCNLVLWAFLLWCNSHRAAPPSAYYGSLSHPQVTVQDWIMKDPHLMGRTSSITTIWRILMCNVATQCS